MPQDFNQCLRSASHITRLSSGFNRLSCYLPNFSYPFFEAIPFGCNVRILPLSQFNPGSSCSILIDLSAEKVAGAPFGETVFLSLHGVSNIEFVPKPREASELFDQFAQLVGATGESRLPQPEIRPDHFDKARKKMLDNRFANVIVHAEGRKTKSEISEITGFLKRSYSANVYLLDKAVKTGLDFTSVEQPEVEDLLTMFCMIHESDLFVTDSTPVWEFFRNWFQHCLHWREWRERRNRENELVAYLNHHYKINPRG